VRKIYPSRRAGVHADCRPKCGRAIMPRRDRASILGIRRCKMIEASCHCGAVKIQVPRRPRSLTACNCSICRRLGPLWAYYRMDRVRFVKKRDATRAYAWGAKSITFNVCATCGCLTHWEEIVKTATSRVGLNARLMNPEVLEGARVRRLDGAKTWKYLD